MAILPVYNATIENVGIGAGAGVVAEVELERFPVKGSIVPEFSTGTVAAVWLARGGRNQPGVTLFPMMTSAGVGVIGVSIGVGATKPLFG
ncbi:hypothetical protein LEP3755_59100 [Leptolyngbya sp. NIES-3755]|nr:hypothetical protein LEP3755_59100 [Leptolyngbya sp. NIES-3755]